MGLTREEAYWNSELILLDYCIWQNLDNQAKETLIEGIQIGIDQIYDAHEVELKAKDERIEAQSSVIIACQNAILQKDERITELEAKLESLRGYCRKLIEHFNSKDSRSDYDWGLRDRTITILDKLDEGKEQ